MLQLSQRLRLDLADALAGHRELLADLLKGVICIHADAEAHAQHALLPRRQRSQHPGRRFRRRRFQYRSLGCQQSHCRADRRCRARLPPASRREDQESRRQAAGEIAVNEARAWR